MLIATDGACKRLGKPDCTSTGVAWIVPEDGKVCFKVGFEQNSTSQRGEINGLLKALQYAVKNLRTDEDLIIITDSEYLLNTVSLDWCFKWRADGWRTGSGEQAKNKDMWEDVCELLMSIGKDRVYMQWTKGHLMHYTPGLVKISMKTDQTGVDLYSKILTMVNRPSERGRIVKEFNDNRVTHEQHALPEDTAIEFVVANVMADLLAGYIQTVLDNAYLASQPVAI